MVAPTLPAPITLILLIVISSSVSMKNIVWLLNRPFLIQILIAYIIAIPLGWKLMLPWLEQFTERTGSNILQFVWPLVIVSVVAFCTVRFHVLLALKSKPTENLKME
jgi:Kef-type K+ transport system membrane component KefB